MIGGSALCPCLLPPVADPSAGGCRAIEKGLGVPYVALSQCWFTRAHQPTAWRVHEDDGGIYSICRHCGRRIVTWGRHRWSIADGFDVSQLAETVTGRFLTVLDSADEFVVRRFTVDHLPDEAAIDAFKLELRERYAMDEPGSDLTLLDSAEKKAKRPRKAPPKAVRAGPGTPRTA
jgi:hypothetical protein